MEKYNLTKQEQKNLLIVFGFCCLILAGLLILHPVDALSQFNTSQPGERNPGDLFEFTMENVSGQEDVTHHFTVYSSRLLNINQSYLYWSVLNGQWLNQTPEKGKKWLFVWVEDYTDGATIWPYDTKYFLISLWGNTTINPEPIPMEDLAHRPDKHLNPVMIESVTFGHPVSRDYAYFGDPYGWKDGYYQPRIEPGKSNALSGWILYQVPEKANLKDLQVVGWFMNRGTAYWNLAARNITQVTLTTAPVFTETEISIIQRIGENPNLNPDPVIETKGGRKRA